MIFDIIQEDRDHHKRNKSGLMSASGARSGIIFKLYFVRSRLTYPPLYLSLPILMFLLIYINTLLCSSNAFDFERVLYDLNV